MFSICEKYHSCGLKDKRKNKQAAASISVNIQQIVVQTVLTYHLHIQLNFISLLPENHPNICCKNAANVQYLISHFGHGIDIDTVYAHSMHH